MFNIRFRTVIICSACFLLLGFIGGDRFRAGRNRTRVNELTDIIGEQNREIASLTGRIDGYIYTVERIEAELGDAKDRLNSGADETGAVASGLQQDSESAQSALDRVRNIRQAIKNYQDSTNSSGSPGGY